MTLRLMHFFLLIAAVAVLAACSGEPATPAPNVSHTLDVTEAGARPGGDASALDSQQNPSIINDPNARNGKAYFFARTGDALLWDGIPPGRYEIRVTARADLYQGAPELRLSLGNDSPLLRKIESLDYQTVSYGSVYVGQSGEVALSFANDLYGGSSETDRNIILSHAVAVPIPESTGSR